MSCAPVGPGCNSISGSNGGASTNRNGLAATANGALYNEDVEPPDQGLCAGNGYEMEAINIGEVQVFNRNLHPVSGITTLDSLMGLTTLGYSSGGDPSCLYDPGNGGHWFITEIVSTNTEASGGAFTGCFAAAYDGCREGLAVSTNDNPLSTSWDIYFLDPNTLSPGDPGAGYLLNDFGKMGNTRDALLFFYDEFILNPADIPACPAFGCVSFNGAQELAIQKNALELGYNRVNLVHENMGTDPYIQPPDGNCDSGAGAGIDCWAAIIPASSTAGQFDNQYGGTGFMVGSLDFESFALGTGSGDNRVAAFYWTGLKNLDSLGCSSCALISFGGQLFTGVEPYREGEQDCPASSGGYCTLAPQRLGKLDLGTYCASLPAAQPLASKQPCPEGGIATNGDFATQASYSGGDIWFAIPTLIDETFTGAPSEYHTGAAYWVISTSSFTGARQLLTVTGQGYAAAAHEDLAFPTLVGSPSDQAVMSFTLTGNGGPNRADGGGYFPSSAFGWVTPTSGGLVGSEVYVTALGKAPQDGFSEYQGLPGPVRPRWGDYGAVVYVAGEGFYFASEYIAHPNCNPAYWYKVDMSCGGTRDPFANFGTSINKVS